MAHLEICPHCYQRVVVADDASDVEHNCNSGRKVLDYEDIPKVSDSFTNPDGSSGLNPNFELSSHENIIQGTKGAIEGDKVWMFDIWGNRLQTHRERKHFEFWETKKNILK